MAEFVFLSEINRERYVRIVTSLGRFLARVGIHPDVLTTTGMVLSLLGGGALSTGLFFWGAWIIVLAGTCDALDGTLARLSGKSSPFGAFLDSTLDRFSDAFPLLGLAYYFAGGEPWLRLYGSRSAGESSPFAVVVIILAITGSFMVSYTRARAEAMGVECSKGFMQRPERVTLLIIGSLLGSIPVVGPLLLKAVLLILALSTNLTAIQRIYHVWNVFHQERRQP
jgi:CDP-diacylglycerol--glycerol-3-phosphate 3-phosphatidyltransferase